MRNATLQTMRQLKLHGMADSYEAACQLPINKLPDIHQLVANMADAEQLHRSNKKMSMYLRLSKVRYPATIQDIICNDKRNLSKTQLHTLADSSYIDRAENILISGATGCGKSYIACAMVHQACVLGYRALYFNLNRFIEQIALAKLDGSFIKWMNRIQKAKLIVLDDFGLTEMTTQVKLALLQILEDRYGNGATVICSQLPVKKWHQWIDDPTIADAILDRLVAKAHRIELKGQSLRQKVSQ